MSSGGAMSNKVAKAINKNTANLPSKIQKLKSPLTV